MASPKTSFKQIGKSSSKSTNHCDVVFIHGLKGTNRKKTKALRQNLKTWLRSLKSEQVGSICVFAFNVLDLLRGRPDNMKVISDTFLTNVFENTANPTILIAHGLAGWVVKDALASKGVLSLKITNRTTRIMFLALPELSSKDKWDRSTSTLVNQIGHRSRTSAKSHNSLEFESLEGTSQRFEEGRKKNILVDHLYPQPSLAHHDTKWSRESSSSKELLPEEQEFLSLSLVDIVLGDGLDLQIKSRIQNSNTSPPRTTLPDGSTENMKTSPRFSDGERGGKEPPLLTLTASDGETWNFLGREKGLRSEKSLRSFKSGSGTEQELWSLKAQRSETLKRSPSSRSSQALVVYADAETESTGAMEALILADRYNQGGELQKASALYQESKEIFLMSRQFHKLEEEVVKIDCRIAELHVHEGRYRQAEIEFRKLENKARDNHNHPEGNVQIIEIRRWLGVVYDKQGHYFKAENQLAKVKDDMEESLRYQSGKMTEAYKDNALMARNALSLAFAHAGSFVRAITENDEALVLATKDGTGNGNLSSRTGSIRLNRAAIFTFYERFDKAEEENRKARHFLEDQFGRNHIKILDCWILDVELLIASGKMDKAEEKCEKTLQRLRAELDRDHPYILEMLRALVMIYMAQARLANALHTALRVVESCKRNPSLGPEHPQTIKSESTLAMVLAVRGDCDAALKLQQKVVDKLEWDDQSLGVKHTVTLSYKSQLAAINCIKGDWNTANKISREVFGQQCQNFVDECDNTTTKYQDTLLPKKELEEVYQAQLTRHLEALRAHDYSKFPLSMLSTMHHLGVSERERPGGNIERAHTVLQAVVQYRQNGLPDGHADTLSSRFQLARTKRFEGNLEEAKKDFQSILVAQRSVLDRDHPDILATVHELGVIRFAQGALEEAMKLETVLQMRVALLGQDHPEIIRSQLEISVLQSMAGKLAQARANQETVLRVQLRVTLSDDIRLDKWKQLYADAFAIIPIYGFQEPQKALSKFQQKLPQESEGKNAVSDTGSGLDQQEIKEPFSEEGYFPEIILSLSRLAAIYADSRDLDKAIKLQQSIVALQRARYGESEFATRQSIQSLKNMEAVSARVQDYAGYSPAKGHTDVMPIDL